MLKQKTQGSRKKPYKKPNLRVYGNIQTLTQGIMSSAKNRDQAGGGMLKTA